MLGTELTTGGSRTNIVFSKYINDVLNDKSVFPTYARISIKKLTIINARAKNLHLRAKSVHGIQNLANVSNFE